MDLVAKATDSVAGRSSGVRITDVSVANYRRSRSQPISNGLHTYSDVEFAFVKIETNAGVTGYGVGRPKAGEKEFRDLFGAMLIGRDPTMTEAIWADLWSPKLYGRRGLETRALSSIDIALWDIKAKVAGMPLYKMLGGFRTASRPTSPAAITRRARSTKELQAEMVYNVEMGARAVKMKVGAVPIREDVERVKAVREAIGPDVKLMVDANCAYRYYEAIQFASRIEEYDVFWFEEPVQPDDYEGFRKIAAATTIPIATGENEYTTLRLPRPDRDAGRRHPAADARYSGGVTEFMKVAALAQAHELDICPHGDQQAHLHLVAAIPNGLMLEFYRRRSPRFTRTSIFTRRRSMPTAR